MMEQSLIRAACISVLTLLMVCACINQKSRPREARQPKIKPSTLKTGNNERENSAKALPAPQRPVSMGATQHQNPSNQTQALPSFQTPQPPTIPSDSGHIVIHSEPWAIVFVDGGIASNTTVENQITLKAGAHYLKLVRKGYVPVVDTICVVPGKMIQRRYVLKPVSSRQS